MTEPVRRELPVVRKGQGNVKLSREEFEHRYRERFYDPTFDAVSTELDRVVEVAWKNYDEYHKSPRTRKAGAEFADPDFDLPIEWLETRTRIQEAERKQRDPATPRRVLVVCGSSRHDETCPGEMSKTFRLVQLAREIIDASVGFECDLLDLSMLTAQFGRQIHPCKACVATAMPLCNWPCSCYPNHAMGQVNDWMNELYPRWVAAHGVIILTSVNWYQAPSVLKQMIDRLVCADGGNPDPTRTHGKKPDEAKALELGAGTFRSTSRVGHSESWSMATPREPRYCAVLSPTGCSTWISCAPVMRRRSTGTSATTSRMQRVTKRSIVIRRCRKRRGTSRAAWSRP